MRKMMTIILILISILAMAVWVCLNIRLPSTDGDSMEPTYYDGDELILYKTQLVNRGDVIVVWCDDLRQYVLKRVVGTAGDVIHIDTSGLTVNGSLLYESYVKSNSWMTNQTAIDIIVPDNTVYVLGDNRVISYDSRKCGPISTDNILGRIVEF